MPRKSDSIPINNENHDKRVKLTAEDREQVRSDYETGMFSQRALAKKYGVSRRLIQFILQPEKEEINKQQFLERQKDGRYYSKEKQREYMKSHRDHKKELYQKGLLGE